MSTKRHAHIPLQSGGHLTWNGDTPPTPDVLALFNEMAQRACLLVDAKQAEKNINEMARRIKE